MQRCFLSVCSRNAENETQEVVLDAEWDEDEERWKDNGSTLSHAEGDEISRTLDKWRADRDREQERERQQRFCIEGVITMIVSGFQYYRHYS